MSKTKQNAKTRSKSQAAPNTKATPLLVLAALALASAVWSAFQWNELLTLRAGGEIFCAVGSAAGCAALADSSFAIAVQRLSVLPIAGWGLVWSGAALALPLGALLRRSADGGEEPFWTATLLLAAGGVVAVLVLGVVSGAEGAICANCVITYLLVCGYAAVCATRSKRGGAATLQLPMGAGVSAIAMLVGFAALAYPGMQTPFPQDQAAKAAIEKALESSGHAGHDHATHAPRATAPAPPGGDLASLIAALDPEMRQALSDTLAAYAAATTAPASAPRALTGSPDAPVRITDFTDTLCGHCANLHATLASLMQRLPPGSFSIDARHFPLDGNCNAQVSRRQPNPVSCVAASAQICFENHPASFEYAGLLYENQNTLDIETIYRLAAPHMSRSELESCVTSADTRAKLDADIARAMEFNIRGTPLVLVNDRLAAAFPPLLYALVVTGGRVDDPAFDALPAALPPEPRASH